MKSVLMMKGLPGSGKSTHARNLALERDYVRISKDDMRAMYHAGKHTKGHEAFVINMRDAAILQALRAGHNVVIDDTNLNPIHQEHIQQLVADWNESNGYKGTNKEAYFSIQFMETPLEECIKRDLQRTNSVGERVIKSMYKQYLAPKPAVYNPAPGLPQAIICDIDGTLAHMTNRSPYDWGRVGEDKIDLLIKRIVLNEIRAGVAVLFVSGRDSVCRDITAQWLHVNGIDNYELLLMRPENDNRSDAIIKKELFEASIRAHYNVLYVLDDRDRVVQMWRNELGLRVLQVAEGDF